MDILEFDDQSSTPKSGEFFSGRLPGWGCVVGSFDSLKNAIKIDDQGHRHRGATPLSMSEIYRLYNCHSHPFNRSNLKRSDTVSQGFDTSINGSAKGEQRSNDFRSQYFRDIPTERRQQGPRIG